MPRREIGLPFSGDLLREVRERHGLTQNQLADRCRAKNHKMSRSSVAGYEAGDRKPGVEALTALVDGFAGLAKPGQRDVQLDDFLAKPRRKQRRLAAAGAAPAATS